MDIRQYQDKLLAEGLDEVETDAYYAALEQLNEPLLFNGVDAETGDSGEPPITAAALKQRIGGGPRATADERAELRRKQIKQFPIRPGNDPQDLAQAGWAVVFPQVLEAGDVSRFAAIREALAPLLALRQAQAGDRFKIYEGAEGAFQGDSARKFLERRRVAPGQADPLEMPYYVLLVGSLRHISERFQTDLDVMRGVGRIWFDTIAEFAAYADGVVRSERGEVRRAQQLALWGVNKPNDATTLSADLLIKPLQRWAQQAALMRSSTAGTRRIDWSLATHLGAGEATADRLGRLLGGDATPALLLTASHGLGLRRDKPLQAAHNGALISEGWSHQRFAPVPREAYITGEDIGAGADVTGMIAFMFACFSAGTPQFSDYALSDDVTATARPQIAEQPFLARLPTRLLGHPRGGALAVIGHVERARGYSLISATNVRQTRVFEDTLRSLMLGERVGWAMEPFNMRFADLGTRLASELEDPYEFKAARPVDIVALWTCHNDARGYIVLGDPAVRIPVVETAAS